MQAVIRLCLLVLGLAACGSFDDPKIVYDMRVVGAIAEPPEVLIAQDATEEELLALPAIEVCALVADPGDSRELAFKMVACPDNRRDRCDADAQPQVNLGSGTVEDPEEADTPVQICASLGPSPGLAEVIERSVSIDSLSGFGAIDIQIGISIWPAGNNVDQAIFATKKMRFGIAIPEARTPNENPALESIIVSREASGPRGLDFELPLGRCGDIEAPIVAPGEELGFLPVEQEGARQDYLVPTFDGDSRSFTETLRYQFLSTEGDWSQGSTGGGRDISGKLPPLDNRWRAPKDLELIGDGLDATLYIIQRDERGGQSWAQSCVHVMP